MNILMLSMPKHTQQLEVEKTIRKISREKKIIAIGLADKQCEYYMLDVNLTSIKTYERKEITRHISHSIIRSSWMIWEHPEEIFKLVYQMIHPNVVIKYFDIDGYKHFDTTVPHLANQMYHEPARYILYSFIKRASKDMKITQEDISLLFVPKQLLEPISLVANDLSKTGKFEGISENDVNILLAVGKSYWLLVVCAYWVIPYTAITIIWKIARRWFGKDQVMILSSSSRLSSDSSRD